MPAFRLVNVLVLVAFASFPAVGAVVASRRPENALWLILAGIGLSLVLVTFSQEYALYALVRKPASLPGGEAAAWVNTWIYNSAAGLPALLILLFPTGRLPSHRWRWAVWLIALAAVMAFVGFGFKPGSTDPSNPTSPIRNPLGIQSARWILDPLSWGSIALVAVCAVTAVVSLVLRLRQARGDERQQLKWFSYAAALVGIAFILGSLEFAVGTRGPLTASVLILFGISSLIALNIAVAIAILKYRLYDIDFLINKTLLFGLLAAFITSVYVAIVVGIGVLLGNGRQPNLALSILATAIVAVAFQPVRERAQRLANRLVYGTRANPYEILSRLSDDIAGAYSGDEILPRMARAFCEAVRGVQADVWMPVGVEMVCAASWPKVSTPVPREAVTRAAKVRYQGEHLGELTVTKSAGIPLSPAEEKLLADLAAQAGPVLHNFRLTAELRARLAELSSQAVEVRESRQRIVTAQDAERRRLERDIHDGLQQQVVALMAKIRLARNQAARNSRTTPVTLSELQEDAEHLLDDLRELAQGIHPAILTDGGFIEAVRARAARLPMKVTIDADRAIRHARYPQEIEGTAYFFVCEGLTNTLKHAAAERATICISAGDGELEVEVADDGRGFDPARVSRSGLRGLKDRIEAIGGTFRIVAQPGSGTRLIASLPVRDRQHG
jgi:signal transduction histidine kinase